MDKVTFWPQVFSLISAWKIINGYQSQNTNHKTCKGEVVMDPTLSCSDTSAQLESCLMSNRKLIEVEPRWSLPDSSAWVIWLAVVSLSVSSLWASHWCASG